MLKDIRAPHCLICLLSWVVASSLCFADQLKQNTDSTMIESKSARDMDGVSINDLSKRNYEAALEFEQRRYARENYFGDLYSYKADGLKLYTLVNTPTGSVPENGFPVIIFGHGFHPDPPNYGVTDSGETSRPGDYYRGIPEAYAEKGFVVVSPDYRGHNISEGIEFTKTSFLASSYYASDVLHLLAALPSLKGVNLQRLYYVGHSMGGDVGLKVLLASKQFKAASLWAPVTATTYQRALYYGGQVYEPTEGNEKHSHGIGSAEMREMTSEIDLIYAGLQRRVRPSQVNPITNLDSLSLPVIIHHARDDEVVPYLWTENLVVKLHELGKQFKLYPYDSDEHLFLAKNKALAIERDVEFFSHHSSNLL